MIVYAKGTPEEVALLGLMCRIAFQARMRILLYGSRTPMRVAELSATLAGLCVPEFAWGNA